MKVALVTTTINVPEVLRLYRALDPDVYFFIATDDRSPFDDISSLAKDIGNCDVVSPQAYDKRYACSKLLGRNTVARRSCAILDALAWGADVIITVDDDNVALPPDYSEHFLRAFGMCNFITVKSPSGWFDVGQLLVPPASHRGFPHDILPSPYQYGFTTNARVGVAAGICLGDPDVSAVTRIANHPEVHGVSELLRCGLTANPQNTISVFNSQNTAFIRELAPCFLMVPQFQRYDDIFASLVAQRIMREHDFLVHFGKPFVIQQRNPHDLLKDLEAEMWGQKYIRDFADCLAFHTFKSTSVLDQLEELTASLPSFIPVRVTELWDAWLADCRMVMA